MPVEANGSIRVNVPDLKAEIEIECLPYSSFWHLKLCLVDGILSKRRRQSQTTALDAPQSSSWSSSWSSSLSINRRSVSVEREKHKRPLLQLVANSLKCRQQPNKAAAVGYKPKPCMPFTATTSRTSKVTSCPSSKTTLKRCCNDAFITRCHSAASSITTSTTTDDTSSGSAFETACSIAQHNNHNSSNNNNTTTATFARSQSQVRAVVSSSTSSPSPPAFYYGFSTSGVSLYDHDNDDNARQSSDLTEDEVAAVRALALATADSNSSYATAAGSSCDEAVNGNYNEYSTSGSICRGDFLNDHGNLRIGDLLELDERNDEYNVYETLRFNKQPSEDQSLISSKHGDSGNSSEHKNNDDDDEEEEENDGNDNDNCDNCDGLVDVSCESANATTSRRLFEQILQSGYLNYGFYSFSLAKFLDDQTSLTEYLSLVSSSTGASYYLDLEFKLKQRQQIQPLTLLSSSSRSAYAPGYDASHAHYALHLTAVSQLDSADRLSQSKSTSGSNYLDVISLRSNSRLSDLNLLSSRIKRTSSICALGTNESTSQVLDASTDLSYLQQHPQQQSFTTNMIAKLASNSGGGSQKSSSAASQQATKYFSSAAAAQATAATSSSQCKRKRAKMLDLLLNTNWSKRSQQARNLMKLNKVLLVCDTNFLDEKTGESPLSLAINSLQINASTSAAAAVATTTTTTATNRLLSSSANSSSSLGSSIGGCSQSASLFDLQYQQPTTNLNAQTLQQTSATDVSQSKAPLVEKILLLLVKSGALIDFRNSDGRTPLHVAAMKSNFWALKTLLNLGASTDYRDINGLTPLYYSILHRAELKVTQLLLNYMSSKSFSASQFELQNLTSGDGGGRENCMSGKSIGISDQHGWQEVHQACKLGLDAHLDKLLYYGCDINAKISGSGNTPLHVAAINDQLQAAKVLLLRGADRTITNNSHQTAHQVAVVSNNMDLAEFIASHDDAKVVPFSDKSRANNLNKRHSFITPKSQNVMNGDCNSRFGRMSMPPPPPSQPLVTSDSTNTITPAADCTINMKLSQQGGKTPTGIVQSLQISDMQAQQNRLNPLTLDVGNHHSSGGGGSAASSAPSTNTSGSSHQTAQSSLLSINSSSTASHQGGVPAAANNISPSLSQRSCGTSNTTASSGVCCDGDNHNNPDTALIRSQNQQQQPSNITIISIGSSSGATSRDRSTDINKRIDEQNVPPPPAPISAATNDDLLMRPPVYTTNGEDRECEAAANEDEDFSSSESSSGNGLQSLMSSERPLFAGSIVEATSDYQSGDPDHLQLRREDLIEVLEYPAGLIRDGQPPRLANKPMLFGRRQSDATTGLFPSFCVRRTKRKQSSLRQRIPMTDVTNNLRNTVAKGANEQQQQQQLGYQAIRGTYLPGSQSMAAIGEKQQQPKMSFKEYQVTLSKINEGFGFVLRGAKINPATLATHSAGDGKISIDERLMIANNLASLQYLDDIEANSVAHQAGLKRGDFLIAVNNQDVRLSSHENVVQMIRSSGDRVHLTIATPVFVQPPAHQYPTSDHTMLYSSRTLTRGAKPEPPKRDPTTTLTRNKSQKVRSMSVAPQIQEQPQQQQYQQTSAEQQAAAATHGFDANKPLPKAPVCYEEQRQQESPANSLTSQQLNRPISANISSHRSNNSLSSSIGPDSQSITSISTVGSMDQQQKSNNHYSISSLSSQHQNQILDQSSSTSTTTLTTVATTKPQAPVKPSSIYPNKSSCVVQACLPDQSTYQSAAAVSAANRCQSPISNRKIPETSRICEMSNNHLTQVAPPPPPLPPPSPPPLPDFASTAATPSKNYLANRRTSAPTNPTPSSLLNGNRLLKKRESLAVVSTDSNSGPAPICTVAAACAAAANSRLQRQQQQQKEEEQQQQQQRQRQEDVGQPRKARVQKIEETIRGSSPHVLESKSQHKDAAKTTTTNSTTVTKTDDSAKINQPIGSGVAAPANCLGTGVESAPNKALATNEDVSAKVDPASRTTNAINTTSGINRDPTASTRLIHQSATLGRKSSAQIIQQPKQNSCVTHSQTLRAVAAPKRMSILDYEMPPPPPPTLPPPPPPPSQQQVFVDQRRPINNGIVYQEHHDHQFSRQQQQQHHHLHRHYAQQQQHRHHTRTHDHYQQQERSQDCCDHQQLVHEQKPVNRFQQEMSVQQIQNQHQLIMRQQQQQQQMRQQQILQERLAAQQQQQKVCQHFHNAAIGQNDINLRQHQHQQQKANGVIDAMKFHPSQHLQLQSNIIDTGATTHVITQQNHKHNHRQHHHQHHLHNHHHEVAAAPAQHIQDGPVLNHHQHHQHHHHHHQHHHHQKGITHQDQQQQRILQQQHQNCMPCIDTNHNSYLPAAATLNR